MLRSGKYTDESAEHEAETALRLWWLKLRNRRRVTDDDLQLQGMKGLL